MAIFRYGWHPWILVPTWCPPCIFTNFSWAKSHNFFIKQKSKFTEIFNICWKHVPFILCRSSQFDQMFYISVNFDFCIMKKLWDLAHEKLVNILGGHHVGTNIHGCQPYLKIAIYVLKSANGGLLCRPLYQRKEEKKTPTWKSSHLENWLVHPHLDTNYITHFVKQGPPLP